MESGNDYVIQVKGNQPNLLKAIKETISKNVPRDIDYTLEKNKGRTEHRETYVYSALDNSVYTEWLGIREIIHIISTGVRNNQSYSENRYYISSKKYIQAKIYNKNIREHWGIENRLHWVKDTILQEDKSKIIDYDSTTNMSFIRNTVINLFRLKGYKSIKYAIEKYTNRLELCIRLISKNITYE